MARLKFTSSEATNADPCSLSELTHTQIHYIQSRILESFNIFDIIDLIKTISI